MQDENLDTAFTRSENNPAVIALEQQNWKVFEILFQRYLHLMQFKYGSGDGLAKAPVEEKFEKHFG